MAHRVNGILSKYVLNNAEWLFIKDQDFCDDLDKHMFEIKIIIATK